MADQKISQLTSYTTPLLTDVLPIVDVTNTTTKKINFSALNNSLFNVKNYGAKGDSATDDTTAIQAAYTAATANGGIIFFPAGTYITNAGVTSNSAGVIWRGSGWNTVLKAGTSAVPFRATGQVFVEDITFDGASLAANAATQSVVTESSYPSLWKNVQWQNATSYQYVNTGCEDVTYLECRTPGNESSPTTVPASIQVVIPTGAIRILGGSLFGKCDLNYQQITVIGAVIGPIVIENNSALSASILNLDGCYIYDGGVGSDTCINTANNLTSIFAKGCWFVAQVQRNWINGNIPSGANITVDTCAFVWGPGTAGNNYALSASGAGTFNLINHVTQLGSATFNIFNPVASPTTILNNIGSLSLVGTTPIYSLLVATNKYADWTYDGNNMDIEVSSGDLNIRAGLAGGALGNVNIWSLLGNSKLRVGNQNFTQALDFKHDGTQGYVSSTTGGVGIETSSGKIGFFGITPISRAVLATGASHTVDDVITALQNLGLVKQA